MTGVQTCALPIYDKDYKVLMCPNVNCELFPTVALWKSDIKFKLEIEIPKGDTVCLRLRQNKQTTLTFTKFRNVWRLFSVTGLIFRFDWFEPFSAFTTWFIRKTKCFISVKLTREDSCCLPENRTVRYLWWRKFHLISWSWLADFRLQIHTYGTKATSDNLD